MLDPRSAGSPADLSQQLDLALKVARQMAKCVQLSRLGTSLREQLSAAKNKTSDAAMVSQIVSMEADVERIFGAAGGWDAPASASGVGAVLADLAAINGVLDSADRMPPEPANALYEQASTALATHQAEWEKLKTGKLADLNRALRAKNQKEIN